MGETVRSRAGHCGIQMKSIPDRVALQDTIGLQPMECQFQPYEEGRVLEIPSGFSR